MADLDRRVANLLDSRSRSSQPQKNADDENDTEDEDVDAMIASLETDSAVDAFRERRLEQLSAELSREKDFRNAGHGSYSRLTDEKILMDIVSRTKLAVIHFYRPDFARCKIMDEHLEKLAEKHFDTRFVGIDVDNAPFLVTKLGIQVLPCVLAYIDGDCVDRVIGFEGLGREKDDFTTTDLERRLLSASVLVRAKLDA